MKLHWSGNIQRNYKDIKTGHNNSHGHFLTPTPTIIFERQTNGYFIAAITFNNIAVGLSNIAAMVGVGVRKYPWELL